MKEIITGVGLIVIEPTGRLLVLEELRDKLHIKKEKGMLSIPFETAEEDESPEETLERLIHEEIGVAFTNNAQAFKEMFCFNHDTCTVKVTIFSTYSEKAFIATPNDSDVAYHDWMYPHKLLEVKHKRVEIQPIFESFFCM